MAYMNGKPVLLNGNINHTVMSEDEVKNLVDEKLEQYIPNTALYGAEPIQETITAEYFEIGGLYAGTGEEINATNRVKTDRIICGIEQPISITSNSAVKWLVHFFEDENWLGKTAMTSTDCDNVLDCTVEMGSITDKSKITHIKLLLGYVDNREVTNIADLVGQFSIVRTSTDSVDPIIATRDWTKDEFGVSKKYFNTPAYYELVVGDTFELFWKGVLLVNNPYNYNIKATCNEGKTYRRKYVFTPTQVGTHSLTLELYDDTETLLDTVTVNLIVKEKAASPSTQKNVLCVGDSLLVGGEWATESRRRLTESGGTPTADGLSNINYIGTCQVGNTKFEGYGGWAFDAYNTEHKSNRFMWVTCTHDKTAIDQHSIYKDGNDNTWKIETIESNRIKVIRTNESGVLPTNGTLTWESGGKNHSNIIYTDAVQANGNPFWNEITGAVDFTNYATNQGVSSIDYVYVLLGWNSIGLSSDIYKTQVNLFISNIHNAFPNCKVVLIGLQVPALDGLGENYGCSWNYIDKLKKVFEFNDLYKSIAESTENVYFVNLAGQFDTENNMLVAERTVNARNATTETLQINGVHPAESGYLQIADVVYRSIVHRLQD